MTTLWIILSLVSGIAAGWYLAAQRARAKWTGELAASTATLTETRARLESSQGEMQVLRSALESERITSAQAGTKLEAAAAQLDEQRRVVTDMQEKLRDSFKALSAEALKSSNEQFITLADARLRPIREQLERYEKQVLELEKTRAGAYSGLTEQLKTLEASGQQIVRETGQLTAALRQPGAKGKWGEVTLQRIVELSGMTAHCDFVVQSQEGGQRPDLVVQLPGGRSIVVDAKVNTSAYLDAAGATTEEDRSRHLSRYADAVRASLKNLSTKEYWKTFASAEFVVMFVPGEAFFAAALTQDPDLLLDGVQRGVILASPTTLMALLMAVRHGWQQQQAAENAEQIAAAGRELYGRLCTFVEHLDAVRTGLLKAGEAYNKAVGAWSARAIPGARRLKELGAADAASEIADLQQFDLPLRAATDETTTMNTRKAG